MFLAEIAAIRNNLGLRSLCYDATYKDQGVRHKRRETKISSSFWYITTSERLNTFFLIT